MIELACGHLSPRFVPVDELAKTCAPRPGGRALWLVCDLIGVGGATATSFFFLSPPLFAATTIAMIAMTTTTAMIGP